MSTLLSKNSSENFHVFSENFHVLSENFHMLSEFWDRTLLSVEPFPHKGQVKKQKAVEKNRFLFCCYREFGEIYFQSYIK